MTPLTIEFRHGCRMPVQLCIAGRRWGSCNKRGRCAQRIHSLLGVSECMNELSAATKDHRKAAVWRWLLKMLEWRSLNNSQHKIAEPPATGLQQVPAAARQCCRCPCCADASPSSRSHPQLGGGHHQKKKQAAPRAQAASIWKGVGSCCIGCATTGGGRGEALSSRARICFMAASSASTCARAHSPHFPCPTATTSLVSRQLQFLTHCQHQPDSGAGLLPVPPANTA